MRDGKPIPLTSDKKAIEESQYPRGVSVDPSISRENRYRVEGVSSPAWAMQAQNQSLKTQRKMRQSAASISTAQTKTTSIQNEADYQHYDGRRSQTQYTMKAYGQAQIIP